MTDARSPRVPVCEDPPPKCEAPPRSGRTGNGAGITDCARSKYQRADDQESKAAKHAEVARRYAWGRRERRDDREPWSPAKQLSADLATVYRDHWVELDDDKEGRGLFSILLHTLAHRPAFERLAADARAEFAPWLSDDAFERMSAEALRVKRKWRPDTLAQRIGLTYADQQRLGVWRFIGAVDVPKAERDRLRAERRNANKRAKHKAAGGMSRAEYEADSLSQTEPWKAEGISRRTWERRRAKACRKSGTITKSNTPIGATLATPEPASRPLAMRAGMMLRPPPVASTGSPSSLTSMHTFRDQIAAFPSR